MLLGGGGCCEHWGSCFSLWICCLVLVSCSYNFNKLLNSNLIQCACIWSVSPMTIIIHCCLITTSPPAPLTRENNETVQQTWSWRRCPPAVATINIIEIHLISSSSVINGGGRGLCDCRHQGSSDWLASHLHCVAFWLYSRARDSGGSSAKHGRSLNFLNKQQKTILPSLTMRDLKAF